MKKKINPQFLLWKDFFFTFCFAFDPISLAAFDISLSSLRTPHSYFSFVFLMTLIFSISFVRERLYLL